MSLNTNFEVNDNNLSSIDNYSTVNNSNSTQLSKIPEMPSSSQVSVPIKMHKVSIKAEKVIQQTPSQNKIPKISKKIEKKEDTYSVTVQRASQIFKNTPKGEVITKEYTDVDGKVIGEEVLVRAKTVKILKNQIESELKYLKKLPLPISSDISKRIQSLEYKLGLVESFQSDWASTDSQRMLFDKLQEFAKEIGIPVLTNLRTDRVAVAGEKFSINRSSAVTDFSHAGISLQEITDYQDLESLSKGNWKDYYQNLSKDAIDYFKTFYKTDISNRKAFDALLLKLKNKIDDSYGFKTDLEKIKNERTDVLQTQFLQDMLVHFQNKPADSANVLHTRVALLDPTKSPQINKTTGYQNNERTEFLDMKAIYEKLDGATIVFDLEDDKSGPCGPFMDIEGKIHMPKSCSINGIKEAKLTAILFNTAVPYNKKNAPMQRSLNSKSIERLKQQKLTQEQRTQLHEMEKGLETYSKNSFKHAHNLIKFSRNLNGFCSVDCHGGKDRTGYAVALEVYYAIREKMRIRKKQDSSFTEKKYRKSMSKTKNELISPESVTAQAAEDNTGYTVLKIADFKLKLYVSGKGIDYLSGIGRRLSDYLNAAAIFIPEPLVTHPTRHDKTILFDQDKEIQGIKNYVHKHQKDSNAPKE